MDRSKGRTRTAQGQADLCGEGGCKQQRMQSAGGGYDVARDDLGMCIDAWPLNFADQSGARRRGGG
jgi:hypothetical protein